MSSSSGRSSFRSDCENLFDVEELVQIGSRCRELRKEKEMRRESQSESVELIRRLELHVKSLSESRLEDKRRIQKLEKELLNCYQEIDYLQDQLNARNEEVNYLSEHAHDLEVKLAESGPLEEINDLRQELCRCKSEHLLLLQDLETKETELQISLLSVEKLEESITCLTLESQCEIESMRLDIITLDQALFDAKTAQEENMCDKDQLREITEELRFKFQEAQENIKCLDRQNKELREKCATSEFTVKAFFQIIKKQLEGNNAEFSLGELCGKLTIPEEVREISNAIIKKLKLSQDMHLIEKMDGMSQQIHQYELLVKQLKDELREEKLKAKEEAEDLAQEMAELRYKVTCLLEEECKRRACIEQASLQRIAELESQIKREKDKPSTSVLALSDFQCASNSG